jgi:hypothetical protein
MISFELAQELKSAGFTQSTSPYAIYALSEHLRIRRAVAIRFVMVAPRGAEFDRYPATTGW